MQSSSNLQMADRKARTCRSVNEIHQDFQGKIFFEKIMKTTNVSIYPRLTLPSRFVLENGGKIQKSVTLRNVADRKRWTVTISMTHQPRLQTYFSGGWKAFAVAYGLGSGDRVTFVLVAMSMFEVYILRSSGGQSKRDKVPVVRMPTQRSEDSELLRRQEERPIEPQSRCAMTKDIGKKEKPEIALNEFSVVKKKSAEENYAPESAPTVTDSSQLPSDMDSHFFEPMVQQSEQECMSKHHDAKIESLDQTQDELPNFLKWTTSNNRMEIPSSFLKTHFGRIGPRVKLQGIHEGSPVQDVTSTFSRERHPRLFLSGWRNFANDNLLRTGQRLIFMLIDDSFFVVRKI